MQPVVSMDSPTAWLLRILVVVLLQPANGSSQNALGCRQNIRSVESVELDGPGFFHVISSPNYPDRYNASKDTYNCEWKLRAQFGSKIKMHTAHVHTNKNKVCLQNILQVYVDASTEKSKFKDNGLEATCGNNNFPGPLEDIESENEVMVKFKSSDKSDKSSDKFKLIFYSTPLPESLCPADTYKYEGCPSWPNTCCKGEDCCVITAGKTPVEIRSPAYPQDSGANRACSFKVVAPKGARINLNFLDMDILADGTCEHSEDYVEVVDNSTALTSVIGKNGKKFCGNRLPNYPGPSVFMSGGNSLTVTYKTGSTIAPRGKGFKLLMEDGVTGVNVAHYVEEVQHTEHATIRRWMVENIVKDLMRKIAMCTHVLSTEDGVIGVHAARHVEQPQEGELAQTLNKVIMEHLVLVQIQNTAKTNLVDLRDSALTSNIESSFDSTEKGPSETSFNKKQK